MQIVLSRKLLRGWFGFILGKFFVPTGEETTLRAAQQRDREAFQHLMDVHTPALRSFIARRVKESEREDVLQETWLAAWEALPKFDRGSQFKTWLFSICLHKVQDQWRRERSRPTGAVLDESETASAYLPREYGDIELSDALRHYWNACTLEQREMLRLYYADGLTLKEIGKMFNRNLNTVKYQFYRLHKMAADYLPDRIDEVYEARHG